MQSLAHQIRKQFRTRITLCFFIYLFVFIVVTYCDFRQEEKALNNRMASISNELGRYIISQVLVGNEKSIFTKISSLQEKYKVRIKWNKTSDSPSHLIHWAFPFSWGYAEKITSLDGKSFGVVLFSGSFLDDEAFTYNILVKISLLLLFMFMMAVILYPLTLRIPKKLFLEPLLQILSLLKEDRSAFCESNLKMQTTELEDAKNKIVSLIRQVKNESRDAAIGKIALQVAHDIRSPIATLNVLLYEENQLPITQRELLNKVLFRISSIANELLNNPSQYLDQTENKIERVGGQLLQPIVSSIISEKKVQFGQNIQINFNFDEASKCAFVNIGYSEFGRVLSNIINNSIEASPGKAEITVELKVDGNNILLSVTDRGCGIPDDILPKVLTRRFSSGKKNSSGMGLAYAKERIKRAEGEVEVFSRLGEGTSVSITLPICISPQWFSNKIQLMENSVIVIIDDDESIHAAWEKKLLSLKSSYPEITTKNFLDYGAAASYLASYNANVHHCFLVDYELGGADTGLDLIRAYQIQSNAYLVTGKYFDVQVQEACASLGCALLPKEIIASYTFSIHKTLTEIIFLDDDEGLCKAWQLKAKKRNRILSLFSTASELRSVLPFFSKSTLVYIDSNLKYGEKGELICKEAYDLGFEKIYLATGEKNVDCPPWITDVTGKLPPF